MSNIIKIRYNLIHLTVGINNLVGEILVDELYPRHFLWRWTIKRTCITVHVLEKTKILPPANKQLIKSAREEDDCDDYHFSSKCDHDHRAESDLFFLSLMLSTPGSHYACTVAS